MINKNSPGVCFDCHATLAINAGSVSHQHRIRYEVQSAVRLSNKIRRHRFEHDEMTQKQLAEFVGVSRQTMNAIENCQHAPKVDVAIRIADVFGVLVDEMFEFEYDGKPERRPIVTVSTPVQPAKGAERKRHATEPAEPMGYSAVDESPEREITLADLRNIIG